MTTYRSVHYTYGDYDEIAFTSRNDMNLAVWEGEGKVRLYSYTYEDTFRERVGRFLHNGLTQIWDDQLLLDLQVSVGGQVFRCHRLVMAGVSGFFKSELTSEQFRSNSQPDQPDVIVLDDNCITPDTFQLLLEMIYVGRDIVQDENTLDIMKAASYLRIKSLEFRCLDILVKQLGEKSCMKIWDWAEKNNIPTLASKAKGVALSCFQVLRHTEEFLRIPLERLTMMLGHELLHYRNEDDILEAILDWVGFDRADRRQHLKELLPFVCFPYLSTRYLNDLRKNDLIGLRSEFASHLDEALTYHLAALQKDGKKIQMEVLKRQAHALKRLMPGMRRVVLLIGGTVVQDEPLTNVVAVYLDMAHPQSRYREILQFSVASLPQPVGLRFASSMWKHDIYVSGGSRAPDALLVYKPNENAWHKLKSMPQGREDHTMVAADGKLYVMGGRVSTKGGFKVISDISLYDIEADAWKPAGQLPVAVEAAPAVLFSDKIYVFGGRTKSGDKVGLVQRLDLVTGQSQVVAELPQDVEGAKAIVLGKDIVLVCPDGTIYTVHEGHKRRRKVTFADSPEFDDDPLSFLDSLPPKAVEHVAEEKKEEKDTPAQLSGKDKDAGGQEVDWSILDVEGKERVPNLKRATSDEDSMSPGFPRKDRTDEKPSNPATSAAEEETKKTSATGAEKEKTEESDDVDENNDDEEQSDTEEAKVDSTEKDLADADQKTEHEKEESTKEEKEEEVDTHLSEQAGNMNESEAVNGPEEERTEGAENGEADEKEEEDERKPENNPTSYAVVPAEDQDFDVVVTKIASMEKRRDFGLFIRKADVMVVGGQSENGYFLDDILKIHIPTGQVCKTDCKLVIPVSGMQVECTAIHQNYLVQFFDATSCFYGE